jgi:hypothetical protein
VDFNTRIGTPPPHEGGSGVFPPHTPNKRAEHFSAHNGADTPRSQFSDQSVEVARLRDQLDQMKVEMAANKAERLVPQAPVIDIAAVLASQQELLAQALVRDRADDKPRLQQSTIKVEPKVYWPKLGDDGPGGKEVEEFYEKFEEVCGLANNGVGMRDKEMLITLKTCLSGSRRQIYHNVWKAKKSLLDTDIGCGDIYRSIKARLYRFLETSTEQQLRIKTEWYNLSKGRNTTAIQFEASWEQITAEFDEVGLSVTPLHKFLEYIRKVGPPASEQIRMDRRPRDDGKGGKVQQST